VPRQLVRGDRAPQQHQLGRERADPRQLPQLGQGVGRRQRPQPGGVKAAVEGGFADAAQPLRLAPDQAGELGQPREPVRRRERRHHPVAERHRLTELGRHPRLDRGRLPDADPGADDRPGGGLVR